MELTPAMRLERTLSELDGKRPKKRLLLHACCAPCSSYVLEYLNRYFEITLYFDNPNITPEEEYRFRYEELKRLAVQMPLEGEVAVLATPYEPQRFYEAVSGREGDAEGGARCRICYALRLEATARAAQEGGYDYFTTTLSISPYKNAHWLNEIGEALEGKYGVSYLYADFKKKNGYKRSCELSAEYGLYRQDYCGCEFSKRDRDAIGNKNAQ